MGSAKGIPDYRIKGIEDSRLSIRFYNKVDKQLHELLRSQSISFYISKFQILSLSVELELQPHVKQE